MKKYLCVIFSFILIVFLIGCGNNDTTSRVYSQSITIAKMPSTPKCKTSDSISVVNEVIKVLSEIEKEPSKQENINGWQYIIMINIDGKELRYCIGSEIFTDSDGRQYEIKNFEIIEDKINSIYDKINSHEEEYS